MARKARGVIHGGFGKPSAKPPKVKNQAKHLKKLKSKTFKQLVTTQDS